MIIKLFVAHILQLHLVFIGDSPDNTKDNNHWSLVSTAHPAKFENIVEPIIDEVIKVPASLSKLLKLDSSFISIEPRLEKLMDIIL